MTKRNYEVGKGKPPREYCFKPGQSGNPKGRPKGVQNLATVLAKELSERRKVTENGKTRSLTKQQILIKRAVADAAAGKIAVMAKLFDLQLKLFGMASDNDSSQALSADDAALLDEYIEAMMKKKRSGGEGG